MTVSARTKWLAVAISCVVAGSVWVGVSQAAPTTEATSHETTAQLFATVAGPDPGAFGTSLEGAAFDKDGHFYFVDTTAPPGHPKLMGLDLATRKVNELYTDSHSMLNCVGFDSHGTMYLCDLKGRIVSYNPGPRTLTDVLTSVCGTSFVPNDLAIDPADTLYIADYQGTPTSPAGRILTRSAAGVAEPALTGLVHPNGIVLTADRSALWVDEDLSATLDHVGWQLSSPASTTPAATVHKAAYLDLGANAYADSLTVDGQGNVYLAVYGAGEVLEFNSDGIQIGKVVFPDSAPKLTHVAIQPGTRRAFATASGPGGGYIFTFQALAAAPTGVPNGG